ncbi:MAG: aminotransferase V, partial [Faecalibacterium prausnitzii]
LVDIRRDGTIDLGHLKELLRPDTIAVAMTLVDSELGVVQPVKEISELLQAWPNCHLHVDATQAVGKIPVSFEGVDTMSLTAHKFYGLNGIGLLLKRRKLALEPLIHGGESTTIYRSGTPTVALAATLETALEAAVGELPARTARVKEANAFLRDALSKYPKVHINSPENAIPHILNLSVENVKGTVFQRELDAEGVCVSVKSACSSDGLPSRAVFAVSRDRRNALSSWRISLSHLTTQEELDGFLHAFDACYTRLTRPQ